jgi:hypothetical protein
LQAVEQRCSSAVFIMPAKAGIQELIDFAWFGFSGHRPAPV